MSTELDPSFDVHSGDAAGTLLIGLAEYGLAGLTAVEYLTTQLELERIGHVTVEGIPAITPFENGVPRRHTRLFSDPELDITVLVGELGVPPNATGAFAERIASYTDEHDIEETVVLSGVPLAHGPDDHGPFHIATEQYRTARLGDGTDVAPMTGGFLEGVNAELMQRALEESMPSCVLTTPVHPQNPDIEASLRLLEAVDDIYGLGLDVGPLEAFAKDLSKQYEELAARIESDRKEHVADDRMYM